MAALFALALRRDILQEHASTYFGYFISLGVCIAAPALITAVTPGVRLIPALIGSIAIVAALSEPIWRNAVSGLSFYLAQPSITLQSGFALSGIALLARPAFRPGFRVFQLFFIASVVGVIGVVAISTLTQVDGNTPEFLDTAADRQTAINIQVVMGLALAFCASSWVIQRHIAFFAGGAGNAEAAGRSASYAAPYIVFLALSSIPVVGLHTIIYPSYTVSALGLLNLIASIIVPCTMTIMLGAAGHSLLPDTENSAFHFNRRNRTIRELFDGVRPYLASNIGLAAIAMAGIVTVATAFDIVGTLYSGELLTASLLGFAAMLAFISVRAGIILGGLMIVLMMPLRWLSGFPVELYGEEGVSTAASCALLLSGAILSPLVLEWREARDPWRKARDVATRAAMRSTPTFILSLFFVTSGLLAAHGSGFWPPAGAVARWVLLYSVTGYILSPFWFVGFGALFGRGE